MQHATVRLYFGKMRPLIAAVIILVPSLLGCAMWKEAKYGHAKYPAGGGMLTDTNQAPIKAPTSNTR